MSPAAAERPAVAAPERPAAAITTLALRQAGRGALIVATVSAGMSAMVAGTYHRTVGGQLEASSFAALAANPAIRTLFGEPAALDDPGGFTVWRTGTALAVLVGVWGLLSGWLWCAGRAGVRVGVGERGLRRQ